MDSKLFIMRTLFMVDKLKAILFVCETTGSIIAVKINLLFYHISVENVIDKCLYWRLRALWSVIYRRY